MSDLVGERIGAYRITREIARGGMGVVLEAVHQRLGQQAAVKVLSAELADGPRHGDYVERFFDEARALTLIQHPGIVKIIDYGQLPVGTVYIVMEYLEGESLGERLVRRAQEGQAGLPVPVALRVARQIASAIAAAHKKCILHRDLKPANVLLVGDPEAPGAERAKIIDFGIARFLDSPERRTTVGSILGTPAYMSPEQCQGQDTDDKVDVYALGVLLYEMIAGAPPFQGRMADVMLRHMTEEPPPLRSRSGGVPEAIHYLVHSMLAKLPEMRPEMAQVEARIRQWEAEHPVQAAEPEDEATRLVQDAARQLHRGTLALPPGVPTRQMPSWIKQRAERRPLPRALLLSWLGVAVLLGGLLVWWLSLS